MDKKAMLKIRRKGKKKKPEFKRQEYFKHKKLKRKWRRPRGKQSKLRKGEKPRGRKPGPGYRSPRAVRGLTKKGLKIVMVSNPGELEKLKPKTEAAVVRSGVGKKKREEIIKKAKDLGITLEQMSL